MCRVINPNSEEALEKRLVENLLKLNRNFVQAKAAGYDLREKYPSAVDGMFRQIRTDAERLFVVTTLLPSMSYFSSIEEAFSSFKHEESVMTKVFYGQIIEDIETEKYALDEKSIIKILDSVQSLWMQAFRRCAIINSPEIDEFIAKYEAYSRNIDEKTE